MPNPENVTMIFQKFTSYLFIGTAACATYGHSASETNCFRVCYSASAVSTLPTTQVNQGPARGLTTYDYRAPASAAPIRQEPPTSLGSHVYPTASTTSSTRFAAPASGRRNAVNYGAPESTLPASPGSDVSIAESRVPKATEEAIHASMGREASHASPSAPSGGPVVMYRTPQSAASYDNYNCRRPLHMESTCRGCPYHGYKMARPTFDDTYSAAASVSMRRPAASVSPREDHSPYAYDDGFVGAIAPLYTIGNHLDTALESIQNPIHCALGVAQTLAMAAEVSERAIGMEIKNFATVELTPFLQPINEKLSRIRDIAPTEDRSGKTTFFTFKNRAYVLLATQLRLNHDKDAVLKSLRGQIIPVDFSRPAEATVTINGIVARDTSDKIRSIVSADALSADSVFVFLHTLYFKASWKSFPKARDNSFRGIDGVTNNYKFFAFDEHDGILAYIDRKSGTRFVLIPTINGGSVMISHNQRSVAPISQAEVDIFTRSPKVSVHELKVPNVSVTATIDLKETLAGHLPKLLTTTFKTSLTPAPVRISRYIQKLTFEMNEKGAEASAVTYMGGCKGLGISPAPTNPIIHVDSPFSYMLFVQKDGLNIPLFSGMIKDSSVLQRASQRRRIPG